MAENKNTTTNKIAIIFIFAMMVLMATAENVRGVFIPLFKHDFSINDTSIGFMLVVSSIAYIIFTYIGGELCEKIGQKKVYIIGFLAIIASLITLGFSYNYYVFLIGMFLMNIGLSVASIATNTLIPVLFISFQAILINVTHFCYGLGSTVAQRVAGVLLFNGVNWRYIYLVEAFLFMILTVVFMFVNMPESIKNANVKTKKIDVYKDKLVYFYMFGLGFYVFAEIGTGNWFVNFMENNYNYDKSRSSFYLALFFGIFTLGRLLGGFVVERMGYFKTLLTSLVIGAILYLSGIFIGEKGMIVISVAGFFFAITFPTMVLTISKVFKQNGAYTMGLILTISSTTNMLLNLLMGFLNDKIGTYFAFYLIPISLIISITFIFLINKEVLKRNLL